MLSRVFETLKTVLIFLLSVTMLVMMLLLMIVDREGDEAAYPFEERMIFYENGAEAADGAGMNTARIQPTAIAFRSLKTVQEGENGIADKVTLRALSDGELLPRAYAALYPMLQDMLGHAAVNITPYDADALWKNALAADELIYIVYPQDLPTALVYAYTFGSGENGENLSLPANSVYAKELLFCETEEEGLCLLARTEAGNITRFMFGDAAEADTKTNDVATPYETAQNGENTGVGAPEEPAPASAVPSATLLDGGAALHESSLSAYIEIVGNIAKDAYLACFLCELPDDNEKTDHKEEIPVLPHETLNGNMLLDGGLNGEAAEEEVGIYRFGGNAVGIDTALIYQSPRALPVVTLTSFAGMGVLDASESAGLYMLLHTVGMQDNAAENHYVDRDGGRVYLDTDGRLYISSLGEVRYTALQNGGIAGSAFLGYSNISGVYTLSESMQISDKLVTALSERIVPMLCGMERQEGDTIPSNALKTPILSIVAVELEDGVSGVQIRYGYSVNGVLLRSENGTFAESYAVTVSGDAVIAFSVTPLYGTVGETMEYLLPMRVALRALSYENVFVGDRYGILEAAYMVHSEPYVMKPLKPEWLFSEK